MRWLQRLIRGISETRRPTRLDFIEAIPRELEKRYGVQAGTQFVYNHPASGIPEVVVVMPNEDVVIIEFHLMRDRWADVTSDGMTFVPDLVLNNAINRLDRHKEANPDKTLRGIYVTDQRVNTPTVLDCYDEGLTILAPIWSDWFEDYGAGSYRAVRWIAKVLKLREKTCTDPQTT